MKDQGQTQEFQWQLCNICSVFYNCTSQHYSDHPTIQIMWQLFTYLNSHDLLCPSQSAHCPCHSTEMDPLRMTNNILLALDTCDVSVLPFLTCLSVLLSVLLTTIFSSTDFNFSITRAFLALFFHGLSLTSLVDSDCDR